MNTRGASFFNFDWANQEAVNHVCDQCGYVFWFLEPRNIITRIREDASRVTDRGANERDLAVAGR